MSPQQSHAAILLAGGASVAQTAEHIKVVNATIYNCLTKPESKLYVDNLRDQLRTTSLEEATSRLTAAATRAVDRLVELLDHPDPYLRLRASVSVVDMIGRLRDRFEFAKRLEAIEAAQKAREGEIEIRMIEVAKQEHAAAHDDAHERLFAKDIHENANGCVG
jgi:hypothetical protein